jgi:hypothetical protein
MNLLWVVRRLLSPRCVIGHHQRSSKLRLRMCSSGAESCCSKIGCKLSTYLASHTCRTCPSNGAGVLQHWLPDVSGGHFGDISEISAWKLAMLFWPIRKVSGAMTVIETV